MLVKKSWKDIRNAHKKLEQNVAKALQVHFF